MFFGPGMPKEFAEMMEKVFVEKMNEMIRNPDFLSGFSKVVGSGLEGKKQTDDLNREYLQKMNLPSREDISRLLQYLQQLESRIIGLEEKLDELGDLLHGQKGSPSTTGRTARTRGSSPKPVAKGRRKA